jgi:hypothetical protein
MEHLGSPGEIEGLANGDEIPKMPQFHAGGFYSEICVPARQERSLPP